MNLLNRASEAQSIQLVTTLVMPVITGNAVTHFFEDTQLYIATDQQGRRSYKLGSWDIFRKLPSKSSLSSAELVETGDEFDVSHRESLLPSFCCSRFAISSLQAGRTWLPCVFLWGRAHPVERDKNRNHGLKMLVRWARRNQEHFQPFRVLYWRRAEGNDQW